MFEDLKKLGHWLAETSRIRRLIYLYDKLWVRIAVIGALSIVAIGIARLLEPLIPDGLYDTLGAGSVGRLLETIANSMISATIFSLTVMVTIHRSASGQWTPRVHRVLIDDNTSQNVIATMMGAYIFAMASTVLLETGLFPEEQVVVLFVFTILVLILIIFNIVRWAVHLQNFGSLSATANQIESRTRRVMTVRANKQYRGGHALSGIDDIPKDAMAIAADQTGYIDFILEDELNAAAETADADLYFLVEAGDFVFVGETILHATKRSDALDQAITDNIQVGPERSFDEDPRFGFITLGEIGSRAMSPGINDPGTAIDMISRMGRLLMEYEPEREQPEEIVNSRLYCKPLDANDYFGDGILPVLRDGAGIKEVQMMGQRVLAQVSRHPDQRIAEAARWAASVGLEYAQDALTRDDDITALKKASCVTDD